MVPIRLLWERIPRKRFFWTRDHDFCTSTCESQPCGTTVPEIIHIRSSLIRHMPMCLNEISIVLGTFRVLVKSMVVYCPPSRALIASLTRRVLSGNFNFRHFEHSLPRSLIEIYRRPLKPKSSLPSAISLHAASLVEANGFLNPRSQPRIEGLHVLATFTHGGPNGAS